MKTSNENLRLLKPFFRGLPIVIVMITGALILAKRYLRYATPMYESTAKIRLADTKDGTPSANLYKDFDVFATANKIGGEVEVIKSKVIINKTLDSLDFDVATYRVGKVRKVEMYHQSPFRVLYQFSSNKWYDKVFSLTINKDSSFSLLLPGQQTALRAAPGKVIDLNGDRMMLVLNDSLLQKRPNFPLTDRYEFIINSRQHLADFVLSNLDITSVDKEIPILRMNFKSPVPEKAANFINMLARTYVNDYIETKTRAASTTVNFLDNQLKDVGSKLAASENSIESYRNEKGIINIRQETETNLRKISDMKVQQTNVRMNLEAIQNLEKYMVKGRDNVLELAPNFEAYTDLLATELVKKMKQLQAEKKDLLTKYTPEYEEVKNIDDKLKDLSTYLEEGIRNTRKSLETKYDRLSTDIVDAEKAFDGLPDKERIMGILNRNFSLNEQTYTFLHEKRTEAEIARAATISFDRIITPGEVPSAPTSPNATLIKVLAIFLSFLGSVAMIYIVHAIKGKVNDVSTIEKNSAIPVAAMTPMLRKDADIRQYFHKLAIQLEIKEILQQHKVLTVSSFDENEGKAFNVIHLAKELAGQNKSVLIADADGVLTKRGLIKDARPFEYRDLSADPKFFINSNALQKELEAWSAAYDVVLVKNEPIHAASNGLLLMKLSASNLFILDSRKTPAKLVPEADLLQDEYKFANIQFLLNREGYNPNLFAQAKDMIKKVLVKFRKSDRRK